MRRQRSLAIRCLHDRVKHGKGRRRTSVRSRRLFLICHTSSTCWTQGEQEVPHRCLASFLLPEWCDDIRLAFNIDLLFICTTCRPGDMFFWRFPLARIEVFTLVSPPLTSSHACTRLNVCSTLLYPGWVLGLLIHTVNRLTAA